jgi:endo-1,4-beta-xylanase
MWGFTDKESWVPGAFPGWGAALVFDAAYQAKPAHVSLRDLSKWWAQVEFFRELSV